VSLECTVSKEWKWVIFVSQQWIYAKWQIGLVSNIYQCCQAHRSGSACAHSVATHDSLRPKSVGSGSSIQKSTDYKIGPCKSISWRVSVEVCQWDGSNQVLTGPSNQVLAKTVKQSSLGQEGSSNQGVSRCVCVMLSTRKSRPVDILRTIESCASYLPHLTSLTHGISNW